MKLVLIAEDNDEVREAILQMIETEGFDAIGFPDGRGVINYLNEAANERPFLILSDDRMPHLDGPALRRLLSENQAWASLPFVLMSSREHNASSTRNARFLQKPIHAEDLAALLHDDQLTAASPALGESSGDATSDQSIHTLINDVGAARMHAEVAGSYSELSPYVKQHLARIEALLSKAIESLRALDQARAHEAPPPTAN